MKIGVWSFNPQYITGLKIANLPIEEILFFICIPFSCVFMYEVIQIFIKDKENKYFAFVYGGLMILFLGMFFMQVGGLYTSVVTFVACCSIVAIFITGLYKQQNFSIFILSTYIPFMIVNGLLTNIPITNYPAEFITNFRVINIPIEDFIYSFAMLASVMIFYKRIDNILKSHRIHI